MKQCEICSKDIKTDDYYNDTENDYHNECWDTYLIETAISCGIPKSVVMGKTKLSDHFLKKYIDSQCNRSKVSE